MHFLVTAVFLMAVFTGCHTTPPNPGTVPAVTTGQATNITKTSATLSGNVTNDGGQTITNRGIYSSINTPTDKSTKTSAGQGSGKFSVKLTNLSVNTTYYYMAFATNSRGTSLGGVKSFTTVNRDAEVSIEADSNLTMTSVTVKINVTPYGSTIKEVGVCFSTSQNPTTADSKFTSSTLSGVSTISLNGLNNNTKYYLKAYVLTKAGTTIYSQEKKIWTYALVDVDGNGYHTVKIGKQTWTVENLRVTHYRNGDPIPEVKDSTAWLNDKTGAICWYNNDKVKYDSIYGALYNFYAVVDPRGLSPKGWHIPDSRNEWADLYRYIGGNAVGGFMKEKGTSHWHTPNTGASNSTGFTALPGGARERTTVLPNSTGYWNLSYSAVFWTSEAGPMPDGGDAWYLDYNDTWLNNGVFYMDSGLSVRLIKN